MSCQRLRVTRIRTSPWPKTVDGVLLRDPTPADVDVIATFRNLPDVNRWLIVTHESTDELRRRWLSVTSSDTDFSCIAEINGELAGIGFLEIEDGSGQPGKPRGTDAGIGYIVRPGHQGGGVGSAIALGITQAAFVDLGLRRVTAGCFADNAASWRILEKAGLEREQHGRGDSWHAELGWIDGYTYSALAEDWLAEHAH
ncbi:RimJ/RimL family protein N-acetyltransferase [Calidifontibacter indicus]|uniref:RimJ/RimL family protein N-acetyltransferase n=1 Tax=Calidifontibacter indicus TaxID=419650 RepID=A0A3D9UL49_9MICO|nr:RimJ/RimL family protein N-acetyltransferase [Calidifontibacter indicus]